MDRRATIFLGNDLPQAVFADESSRNDRLEKGLRIVSQVEGVKVESLLPALCAVNVTGSAGALDELQHVVEENKLAEMVVEDPKRPAFRSPSLF